MESWFELVEVTENTGKRFQMNSAFRIALKGGWITERFARNQNVSIDNRYTTMKKMILLRTNKIDMLTAFYTHLEFELIFLLF
jgi:hypothetical protein